MFRCYKLHGQPRIPVQGSNIIYIKNNLNAMYFVFFFIILKFYFTIFNQCWPFKHPKKASLSNLFPVSRHLSVLIIVPAFENRRSDVTDIAKTGTYLMANSEKLWKEFLLLLQYVMGASFSICHILLQIKLKLGNYAGCIT